MRFVFKTLFRRIAAMAFFLVVGGAALGGGKFISSQFGLSANGSMYAMLAIFVVLALVVGLVGNFIQTGRFI